MANSYLITKAQWEALKCLHNADRLEIIDAVLENAFDDKEPEFEEWRKEEKTAIYNLMKK